MSIRPAKVTKRSWRPVCVILATLLGTATALAEPLSLDPDAEPATLLEFNAEPKLGDFVGRAQGIVDTSGKRFSLKDLDVMSPLVIQVFAKDPAKPIDVSLHRLMWEQDDWHGVTDANGDWGYLGRVHAELGIELTAAEASPFYVLAWQGPAVRRQFGMVALADGTESKAADGADSPGSAGRILSYVGIAVVAFLLALFVAKKSNRPPAANILLILGSALVLTAPSARGADDLVIEDSTGFPERLLAAESRLQQLETAMELTNDKLAMTQESLDSDLDAVQDMAFENFEAIMALGDQQGRFEAEMQAQVDALRTQMRRKDRSHDRMIAELRALVEEDRDAEPDPTHGGASLPSSCVVGPGEDPAKCGLCFEETNKKLAEQLESYERLRIIYGNTKWQIDQAVTYGDAHSGWHQLEQAEWYEQKQNIIRSFRGTQRAYDDYLVRANRNLERLLKEFGLCEAETGGIDDWYQRWGALFYNIITVRYARND